MRTPSPAVDLSVVIVNYRAADYVRRCVKSIALHGSDVRVEVLVVDNSPGALRGLDAEFSGVNVTLIEAPENLGFACACNLAIQQSHGRAVLLLNPDTEVRPGAFPSLLRTLDTDPAVAAAAPRLLNSDGTLQPSCRPFPSFWVALLDCIGIRLFYPRSPLLGRIRWGIWDANRTREVSQPMGACLCIRREALEDVGLLDERFFVYFEEVDWCLRAHRRGRRIVYTPDAEILHHGGRSADRDAPLAGIAFYRSKIAFYEKHFSGLLLSTMKGILSVELAWKQTLWSILAHLPGAAETPRHRMSGYQAARKAIAGTSHARV